MGRSVVLTIGARVIIASNIMLSALRTLRFAAGEAWRERGRHIADGTK